MKHQIAARSHVQVVCDGPHRMVQMEVVCIFAARVLQITTLSNNRVVHKRIEAASALLPVRRGVSADGHAGKNCRCRRALVQAERLSFLLIGGVVLRITDLVLVVQSSLAQVFVCPRHHRVELHRQSRLNVLRVQAARGGRPMNSCRCRHYILQLLLLSFLQSLGLFKLFKYIRFDKFI